MPTISSFNGVIIFMNLKEKEHNPPHVHAVTPDDVAPFLISTGEMMVTTHFSPKAKKMVKEFILRNQDELLEMWETGNYRKLDPVK